MITIRETLVVEAEGHAVITLPPSVKPGAHRAVLHIEDEVASAPEKRRVVPKAGSLKGIWMSPDFDARSKTSGSTWNEAAARSVRAVRLFAGLRTPGFTIASAR